MQATRVHGVHFFPSFSNCIDLPIIIIDELRIVYIT